MSGISDSLVWRSLLIVVSLFAAQSSAATIDVDTVLDASNPFANETLTVVDGAAPPTRLTIVEGGLVSSETLAIDAYGSSVIDIQGGMLASDDFGMFLNDDSTLFVRGGSFDTSNLAAEARDRSMIEVTDGFLLEGFRLLDSSFLRIIDGDHEGLQVDGLGQSRTVMSGGRSHHIELFDDATFVMHGGLLRESLFMDGRSRAIINDGGVSISMVARGESVLVVRGGFGPEDVRVFDSATMHFFGTGLHFGVDDDLHFIRGVLADGTNLDVRYQIHDQGQIILHEVPEPASWALLALGAFLVRRLSQPRAAAS